MFLCKTICVNKTERQNVSTNLVHCQKAENVALEMISYYINYCFDLTFPMSSFLKSLVQKEELEKHLKHTNI